MRFITDYRLESYILDTRWEQLPGEVQTRLKGCFLDLAGALVAGSRSLQFEVGMRLAQRVFAAGDIPVIGCANRFSFAGAAAVMGHASNAFDIDDGYSLTSIHPGASFIGGVLAAAYEKDVSCREFLTALQVAYEACIRSSHANIDYYGYNHSTGSFGSTGIAAGVGRIYGFTREQMNRALSIADFNATMAPGIRSAEHPSMNKDGVPFGAMVGALSVLETMSGFEGRGHLLEEDAYRHYLDSLGSDYMVMKLYFKPYPCCRWAQPAIDAAIWVMREHRLSPGDVRTITVKTFARATLLSKGIPSTTDEAQYNIAYPVAAAAVYGDFGLAEVQPPAFCDRRIMDFMGRITFEMDPELDAQYPARRIARAVCETVDGRRFVSPDFEPRGEPCENIGFDWLSGKFRRITGSILTAAGQDRILELIRDGEGQSLRDIVDTINQTAHWLG